MTLFPACTSFSSHSFDKILDKKRFKKGKIPGSSEFEDTVCHGQEVLIVGMIQLTTLCP